MIFFKHPRTIPKLSISINGNPVEQVTNFNFLCITLDQNLTWNDHISKISIKVARVIGIMNKVKHKISPSNSTSIIYFSHPPSSHLWIIYLGIFPKTVNNTSLILICHVIFLYLYFYFFACMYMDSCLQ